MSWSDDKAVSIWTGKRRPETPTIQDGIWPATLENVIYPTFEACRGRLDMLRRHSQVTLPAKCSPPFVVLFWTGKNCLENHRIGLQYTYGSNDQFTFDLSVVRFNETSKEQTSLYRERFSVTAHDTDLKETMLAQCMFAMGMAMSLEDPLSIRRAIWNNQPYVRKPTRLC